VWLGARRRPTGHEQEPSVFTSLEDAPTSGHFDSK
jgi:hypothetical protein